MSQKKSHESINDNIEEGSLPLFFNMMGYKDFNQWTKRSILKVPPYITRPNSDAYKPRVVSFGPYHHGQDHLKRMEAYKMESLNRFAKRTNSDPKQYLDKLRELMPQLMAYYTFLNEEWRGDEERFLKLMVVDGCFLLECFRSEIPSLNDPLKNIFRGTMGVQYQERHAPDWEPSAYTSSSHTAQNLPWGSPPAGKSRIRIGFLF